MVSVIRDMDDENEAGSRSIWVGLVCLVLGGVIASGRAS